MHGAKLIATKNQRDNNNNHKLNKQDKIEEERTHNSCLPNSVQ
jgi:hypothetical protein